MSVLQRSPAPRRPDVRPAVLDLRDESGIALVMALAVMLVLTVLVTSTLAFTSSNSRDASLKQSGQSAYALAEAGLSQAISQLESHYYTDSTLATTNGNNTTVYNSSWFTGAGIPSSQQSPSSTAACTSTSTCMSWGPVSWTPSGGAGITKGTLVLRGQGRVPNPTGGTALARTVTEKIDVRQTVQLKPTPNYWSEIYTGATGNTCDLNLTQQVAVTAPLYVAGNLCLQSGASIEGSGVTLKVFGNVTLANGNNSDIGASKTLGPVQSAAIGGGCVKGSGTPTPPCKINTSSTNIWDMSGTSTAPTPTPETLPSINWSQIAAQQAASVATCTNGQSLYAATFYLTPASGAAASGYTCTVTDPTGTATLGSITYDPSKLALTVSGDVYLSGTLDISTPSALNYVNYTGVASLFVAGSVTATNNAILCAHGIKTQGGYACDFANATISSSPDYWDTTKAVLIIQAHGAIAATNLAFQGGLYSDTSINLGGGGSSVQGPLVTPNLIYPGQQLGTSFPSFPFVTTGTLGVAASDYSLSPQGGSF